MKKDKQIRSAIDESLSGVHFNAQDMRTVLRAVCTQETPRREHMRRSGSPLRFALAAAAMVMVIAPLSVFVLRAQHAQTTSITTIIAASQPTDIPQTTCLPGEDRIISPAPSPAASAADDGVFDEHDALRIARECFQAQCDTSIFSFEEYVVSIAAASEGSAASSAYVVEMNSIYDNGCTFRVTISAPDGKILSYSTPKLATVPMYVNNESPEIKAWYETYGTHMFAWPMDVQAEFSRRYEGAVLRMPREDEADVQTIFRRLGPHLQSIDPRDGSESDAYTTYSYYAMLYSERASSDGIARYQVYCFPGGEITDTLPPTCVLLTFRASDGEFESRQILSTSGL